MTARFWMRTLPVIGLLGGLSFIQPASAAPSCKPVYLEVKAPHIKPAKEPRIRLDIYQVSNLDFPLETIILNQISALSQQANIESVTKEANWYTITWKHGVKVKRALRRLRFPELRIDHKNRIILKPQNNAPLDTGLYSENLAAERQDYFREIFALNIQGEGELGGLKNHMRFFESDVQNDYFTIKEVTKLNLGLKYLHYFNPINDEAITPPDVMTTHSYDLPKEPNKTRIIFESLPNNRMLMEFVTYMGEDRA